MMANYSVNESLTMAPTGDENTSWTSALVIVTEGLKVAHNDSGNLSATQAPPSVGPGKYGTLQYVMLFYVPFIILFGTFGNVLSGIVMMRKTFRKIPMSVYLVSLAVFDTVFLFANAMFRMWVGLLFNVQFSQISSWGCKIYVYLLYSSKSISSWLIVAVTVERAIVIALPHKSRVLSTRRRSLYVVAALVSCGMLYFICMLYSFELVKTEHTKEALCYIRDRKTFNVLHVIDVFLYTLIPFVMLIVANSVLVWSLCNRAAFPGKTTTDASTQMQTTRVTVLVLTISCAFITLTLPMGVINLLLSFGVVMYENVFPVWVALYLTNVTNHGVNFVFFCLSGPMFRKEVLELFSKCRPRIRGHFLDSKSSSQPTLDSAVPSVSGNVSAVEI